MNENFQELKQKRSFWKVKVFKCVMFVLILTVGLVIIIKTGQAGEEPNFFADVLPIKPDHDEMKKVGVTQVMRNS